MISVGIDIGSFSIKVVEIDASVKPYEVTQFKEFLLSQDPNKDRKIEIVDTLRNLVAMYEDAAQPVHYVLGVPEWKTSIRRKVFPFKERHKILKSLPFELEDDIPFTLEDSIFDARISRYAGPMAEVIALACPEETVAENVQLAKDIGVDLNVLSVDGLAIPNLFTPWWEPPPQEEPDMDLMGDDEDDEDVDFDDAETKISPSPLSLNVHLHIGHQSTIVLFFAGKVLKAVRNVDWGGSQMAEAISRKYKMHYIDALKEVQKKAFLLTSNDGANKDQVAFSDTLKTEVDKLVHALRLIIVEIESDLGAKVSKAEFSGGVSQMKNLGAYLTTRVECPFNRFSTYKHLPSVAISSSGNSEAVSPVAIALAIEGIKKPRNPAVNLLKGPFSKQGQGLKPLWQKWGHTIQVGLAALVFLFVWSSMRGEKARFMADEAHFEMKTLGQKVAGLSRSKSGSIRDINKFLREQDRVEKGRASAEKVKNISSAMEILENISNSIPKSAVVDVRAMSIDNELAVIQGEAATASAIQTVEKALKKISSNGKVRTRPPTFQASPGKRIFGYSFSIKRNEESQ